VKPSQRLDAEQQSAENRDQTEFEEQQDDEQTLTHHHPWKGEEDKDKPTHL
jgi:hypothetical protein